MHAALSVCCAPTMSGNAPAKSEATSKIVSCLRPILTTVILGGGNFYEGKTKIQKARAVSFLRPFGHPERTTFGARNKQKEGTTKAPSFHSLSDRTAK